MDDFTRQTPTTESFAAQSDDALRDVIKQARSVLQTRETTRKKQAVSEIKRIAKEHGLDVAVNKTARKRGRPRKSGTGPA